MPGIGRPAWNGADEPVKVERLAVFRQIKFIKQRLGGALF
jgi:hypothetical protein